MSEHKRQFEIRPMIEQKPFENPAVQSFFNRWCEINDSIRPQIISREEWEEKSKKGLLEKRPDGMQNLFIPADLQLWEMVGVMEAIDTDTFADKPARQKAKKEELVNLGRTFSNAGVYIAQRLDAIPKGKEIAHALAEEFYEYGESLAGGKKSKTAEINDIASHKLTPEETVEVDKFLAGENLYASRKGRAEKKAAESPKGALLWKDEEYETERQKTLAQFFRVAEKAFLLKQKSEEGELIKPSSRLKPWQSDAPIHSAFLKKVERGVEKQIEKPKTELVGSVFRRGMELLRKNMPFDKLPRHIKSAVLHWEKGETSLREALGMNRLKAELNKVKQTGDVAAVSAKEREIADNIQVVVGSFSYSAKSENPSQMLATQTINCVGASMLGGAFLSELGIKYLAGDVPMHSILVLVTNDNRVEWRDMLNTSANGEITDEEIEGKSQTGKPLSVKDVIDFANNPSEEGLMFDIKSEEYRKKFHWVKEGQRQFLTLFPPEVGQKIQVLHNTGLTLFSLNQFEEAAEVFKQAIAADPKYALPYNGLGGSLLKSGRYEEAVEVYRKAIAIGGDKSNMFLGLARSLAWSGRKNASIEAYEKLISIADEEKDEEMVRKAKDELKGLRGGS